MSRRSAATQVEEHGGIGGRRRSPRSSMAAGVLLLLAVQTGCGREFFRDWANQDVSEAVFEKSRDPRWRIDLFSVEPPALSRHADPYDPDFPAAPPDDFAAQALSPVPQWSDNRLLVPAEGTGYLDMMDTWMAQLPNTAPAGTAANPTSNGAPATPPPAPPAGSASPFGPGTAPAPPGSGAMDPPASGGLVPNGAVPSPPVPNPPAANPRPPVPSANPAAPAPNSGTTPLGLTPRDAKDAQASTRAKPQPGRSPAPQPSRDTGVQLAAYQEPGPAPLPPGGAPVVPPSAGIPPRDIPTPPIGMDPNPVSNDLSAPVNPRPDLPPGEYRGSEAVASEMAGILVPGEIEFNEAEAAGLPRNSRPYIITMDQAFKLALINARVYQFQLENIYLASLAVTLQRFAFQPQLYAGLSPVTGVAPGIAAVGGPAFAGGINPTNQFFYSTRATGTQSSTLNIGTIAGVGKVFDTGGRLLMGFANQIVFNFIGKDSRQPRVQSFLPLSFVQPFLRGGGRAVTLEPLTQAERNLLYQIRTFAQFRQQFLVATLVGGFFQTFGTTAQTAGFSVGGNIDPTTGFLNVLEDIQIVENDRKNIAAFEQLVKVYKELIEGESSGLSQLQLDQVDSALQSARQQLVADRTTYRNDLDSFKMQMGLPPDIPLLPDRGVLRKFKKIYDDIDRWQADPRRDLTDLPVYANALPQLQDIVIDGRSVQAVYAEEKNNEDDLENLLLAAERVALEHRLDLMNARAALYDAWRQIRVTANALKGVLNIAVTNQFLTPPTTTNPFAFVDQAKQFSLVLNAELPLVRVAERNAFRTSLINYQRQRRTLQNQEDFVKLQVRSDIRSVQTQYLNYYYAKRNFVLTIRQKDQAFEQIIAPPMGAVGAGASQAPLQTTNLINFQRQLLTIENQLVTTWLQYQLARLTLYRDLGTLPYDEWEAFHELFPPEPDVAAARVGPGAGPARAATPRPAPPRGQ